MALYYRYVYLLGKTKQRRTTRRCFFLLSEDLRRFHQYCEQFQYIWKNRIESGSELMAMRKKALCEIQMLTGQRKRLYQQKGNAKRNGKEGDAAALTAEIQKLTEQLRAYRKEAAVCGAIEANAQRLRERLSAAEREERHAARLQSQTIQRKDRGHEQRQ